MSYAACVGTAGHSPAQLGGTWGEEGFVGGTFGGIETMTLEDLERQTSAGKSSSPVTIMG